MNRAARLLHNPAIRCAEAAGFTAAILTAAALFAVVLTGELHLAPSVTATTMSAMLLLYGLSAARRLLPDRSPSRTNKSLLLIDIGMAGAAGSIIPLAPLSHSLHGWQITAVAASLLASLALALTGTTRAFIRNLRRKPCKKPAAARGRTLQPGRGQKPDSEPEVRLTVSQFRRNTEGTPRRPVSQETKEKNPLKPISRAAARTYGCSAPPEHQITKVLERLQSVFQRHDKVAVAWSGGKDSTALMELALEARKTVPGSPPLHAVWLDSGAEYNATVQLARELQARPGVCFHWFQVAVLVTECDIPDRTPPFHTWQLEPRTRDWEPSADRRLKLDDGQYFNSMDDTTLPVFGRAARHALGGSPVAVLDALQAAEGPIQAHSLRQGRDDAPYGLNWAWAEEEAGVRYAPLWDWTGKDTWGLIASQGWSYNRAYDRMAELGVPVDRARIGTLYRHGITRMGLLEQVDQQAYHALARQNPGLLAIPRRERYDDDAAKAGGLLSEEG